MKRFHQFSKELWAFCGEKPDLLLDRCHTHNKEYNTERPDSCAVTPTWHASKHKVYKISKVHQVSKEITLAALGSQ